MPLFHGVLSSAEYFDPTAISISLRRLEMLNIYQKFIAPCGIPQQCGKAQQCRY
jgi:hypothetical protein